MKGYKRKYDCMEDCIHIHACRLLVKRYRDAGRRHVPRFCNDECLCYQTAEKVYVCEVENAVDVARSGAESIRGGYDEYDVYCSWDFGGEECYRITNGEYCNDDIANL